MIDPLSEKAQATTHDVLAYVFTKVRTAGLSLEQAQRVEAIIEAALRDVQRETSTTSSRLRAMDAANHLDELALAREETLHWTLFACRSFDDSYGIHAVAGASRDWFRCHH